MRHIINRRIIHPELGEGVAIFVADPDSWSFLPNDGRPETSFQATVMEVERWVKPALTVQNIPVYLDTGNQTPIGFGAIAGNKLTIVVDNQLLVDSVERLARADDIRELFLSFGFSVARPR